MDGRCTGDDSGWISDGQQESLSAGANGLNSVWRGIGERIRNRQEHAPSDSDPPARAALIGHEDDGVNEDGR